MTDSAITGAAEAPPHFSAAEFKGDLSGETDSVATAGSGGTAGFVIGQLLA